MSLDWCGWGPAVSAVVGEVEKVREANSVARTWLQAA
jgi:hypothetical protein